MSAHPRGRFPVAAVCSAIVAAGLFVHVIPQERQNLLKAFQENGPDKLLDALQRSPKVGYIRLPNTLAWDLRYPFETPLPEGGRRVVLATDRPIGFEEARTQPRRIDYPFTLLEIRFNKEGVGQGKTSVYTKISLSKDSRRWSSRTMGSSPYA